jgi:hypothetical protein
MKFKTLKTTVLAIGVILFLNAFPLPALSQLTDDFTTDNNLNTTLWTTSSDFLSALASASSSPPAQWLTPTLNFGSAGMQMSGVNDIYEFTGIQSHSTFASSFTFNTTVMGTDAHGFAFDVYIISGDLSKYFVVGGNLNPANGSYYGMWVNYSGSGTPLGDAPQDLLYGRPSTSVFYTIQMSVDTVGNGSVSLLAPDGGTLASQSGLAVGTGSFYVVLAQREGLPFVTGPNVAVWQSVAIDVPEPSSMILAIATGIGFCILHTLLAKGRRVIHKNAQTRATIHGM